MKLPFAISVVSILLISLACTAKKGLDKATTTADLSSWSGMQPHLEAQRFLPERINIKAKVKYRDEYGRFTFTSNLRILRDEKIWLNASFLGFEVARVLIRQDSVFAINRWDDIYMAEAMEDMEDAIDVSLTYPQMIDVLMGNPMIYEDNVDSYQVTADGFEMSQTVEPFEILQRVDRQILQPIFMQVLDRQSKYQIEASLSDHKRLNEKLFFSYFRDYIIKEDNAQLSQIQINITDVDTTQVKRTPFSIPSHYTRM